MPSPFFIFERVVLTSNYGSDVKLLNILDEKCIPFQFISSREFLNCNFDRRSQGVAAFIKKHLTISLSELLRDRTDGEAHFFVMLDDVEDVGNLGAIARTSAALGIDAIIIEKRRQAPINEVVLQTSAGGLAFVPVCVVSNLGDTIKKMQEKNFMIVSTVCTEKAVDYRRIDIKDRSICVIFGNEGEGIRDSLVKKSDCSVYIPMRNNMNSLNVSVSCGIICASLMGTR